MPTKPKAPAPLRGHYAGRRRRRVVKHFTQPSRTKTDQAKYVNVNAIVGRYDRTGVINHLNQVEGVYADVSELGSYIESVQQVDRARTHFMRLPAGLRARFENDPAKFIDWSLHASQSDRDELYAGVLGLDRATEGRPADLRSPDSTPESPPADAS